jgi:hypothetical protein
MEVISFINEGVLTIGSPMGALTVRAPFQQTASGRLIVGVAGNAPGFDRLVVNKTATLAGTIVANLERRFSPPVGAAIFYSRFEELGILRACWKR